MEFTHLDKQGKAKMVDVGDKNITTRTAYAVGKIILPENIMKAIMDDSVPKGDVLSVARVAGIMGAKNTSSMIPMCHPLLINSCSIDFNVDENNSLIEVMCTVKVDGKTGIEMEALTGVSVALLTIYDMCKGIDKGMVITDILLEKKTGGKSGIYERSK
ncbi:MAG: cyclic pyranopterin monophosphate synthase MoaC [Firmicutes bacterium]|nr:cyclic pyranopterin monophosphate synthase MoaC [Bacillota bacterium]